MFICYWFEHLLIFNAHEYQLFAGYRIGVGQSPLGLFSCMIFICNINITTKNRSHSHRPITFLNNPIKFRITNYTKYKLAILEFKDKIIENFVDRLFLLNFYWQNISLFLKQRILYIVDLNKTNVVQMQIGLTKEGVTMFSYWNWNLIIINVTFNIQSNI